MTLVLVLTVGLALLGFPVWASAWGRGLPPRDWARIVTSSLGMGAAALGTSLLLVAAPTLLAAVGLHYTAAWCDRVMYGIAPAGSAQGWAAVALLGVASAATLRSLRRTAWLRAGAEEGTRLAEVARIDDTEVFVLPAREPMAMAVAGRVAISRGLIEDLSPDQLRMVLRHEAVHLRRRHQRLTLMGRLLRGLLWWLPWARHSLEVQELAVERWADEEAATNPEERRALREALLVASGGGSVGAVPALAPTETLLERIRALEGGAPSAAGVGGRMLLYAPLAVGGSAVVGSFVCTAAVQALLCTAATCLA